MSTTPSCDHDAGVTREELAFDSGGRRCDGWLYRPPGPGPHPCVVLAHGIGGIRSAALPLFATRFAAAGIAALTFDYRHLGTSEGEPRGLIDIKRQRADYRAAIDLARQLDGIDHERIALWGTSFGGGHVLATAARDQRIAAAIIQNPFVDGHAAAAAAIRSAGRVHAYRLAWRAVRDTLAAHRGDPVRVELAGPPLSLAMMTTPDAVAGFASILPADPVGFEPAVPARIVLQMRADRPGRRATLVTCPLLVCVCEHDVIAPPQPAITVAERAPHSELRRYPIGHFDLFHTPWFDRVVDDQIAFLHRTLLEPTATGGE
ncbi:alpha/beta hydrolase [Mycolicibacterium novocastrense]|nr:alpha/beta fold hydrolase [Mycolicibacterium novocastrense]